MKDGLMTAVHTVKVPESEHRLGIGQCIERCKTLHNLHRSSLSVAAWGMSRDIGRWGTITMPAASRNRKASSEALRSPGTTARLVSPSPTARQATGRLALTPPGTCYALLK